MLTSGQELEKQGLETAVESIVVAARTAPKGKSIDNLVTMVASGETIDKLSDEMARISEEFGAGFFKRDSDNLKNVDYVILMGTKINQLGVYPCAYCGYENCEENRQNDGLCAFNTGDLGIAIGSAVSKAADLRVDNRVMFTAGKAALNLGFLGEDVKIAYGLPLSVSGSNIFFDRKPKK